MSTATTQSSRHPKGLWVLFGTEMWERFNFYGMRTLLTLFIVNALMMTEEQSSIIYGAFLSLCYLTPMLGGFISDRYLGNRYCIMLGGLLMAIGQFLFFTSATVFSSNVETGRMILYAGMVFLIFGNGFFKPNISSMVSSLYPKEAKSNLDTAFTIFYIGINLGATLGQIICPMLGDVVDANGTRDVFAFKWGFLAAAIAMLLGTFIFWLLKDKYVVTPEGRAIGDLPSKNLASDYEEGEAQKPHFSTKSILISIAALCALILTFKFAVGQNWIYAVIYSCGLTLAGLILSDGSLTKVERDRILVIYIVSFFIIFFWAAFEQAGSSLTFIAENQTDRHLLGINLPPSMVQSANGIFVMLFAIAFSFLWDWLRARGKEPIPPIKQSIGLLLISLSYFIIANNVKDLGTTGLLAVKWLFLLYMIQTLGELCLSPIGLSLVGKLAPKRFTSLLFGVFFLSNAAGYALAGTLGSILPATGKHFKLAQEKGIDLQSVLDKTYTPTAEELKYLTENQVRIDNPVFAGFTIHNLYEFFMVFVVLCGIASLVLFSLSPMLKRMMHGVK